MNILPTWQITSLLVVGGLYVRHEGRRGQVGQSNLDKA
jgi:hypothetical protein